MSRIRIEQLGITKAGTECIVNVANENLQAGGGVCGVISLFISSRILENRINKPLQRQTALFYVTTYKKFKSLSQEPGIS